MITASIKVTDNLMDFPEKLDEVIQRASFVCEAAAKRFAAVDTGFMRANIKARKVKRGVHVVRSAAPYSEFVEFGTWKSLPQPFMRPALDYVQGWIKKKLGGG